jgi:hypothetical protein
MFHLPSACTNALLLDQLMFRTVDRLDLATPRGLSGAFEAAIKGMRRRMQNIARIERNGDILHDNPQRHRRRRVDERSWPRITFGEWK